MKKIISEINKSHFLEKNILLVNNSCICGISGGQDSVLLFIILFHLKKQWNLNIKVLHFNHFWQKKNFFQSEQVWKLSFIFKTSIYIIPAENYLKNEKKARNWRKKGLKRINSIEKTKKILLGHTASDRIETSFWHLIRGTSSKGLTSLKIKTILVVQNQFFNFPLFSIFNKKILYLYSESHLYRKFLLFKRNELKNKKSQYKKTNNKKSKLNFLLKNNIYSNRIYSSFSLRSSKKKTKTYSFLLFTINTSNTCIYRPLLRFHRNDIKIFLKKYRIPLISDQSNKSFRWSRNRIRQQLFPIIRFFFNPNSEYLFENFLEITLQENNYIELVITKFLEYWLIHGQKLKIEYHLLPQSIQKRILYTLFDCYTNLQPNLLQIQVLRINIEKIK